MVAVINLFMAGNVYTQSVFTLTRIWQGKAIVAAVIIPLFLLLLLKIQKEDTVTNWLWLVCGGTAACLFSGIAAFDYRDAPHLFVLKQSALESESELSDAIRSSEGGMNTGHGFPVIGFVDAAGRFFPFFQENRRKEIIRTGQSFDQASAQYPVGRQIFLQTSYIPRQEEIQHRIRNGSPNPECVIAVIKQNYRTFKSQRAKRDEWDNIVRMHVQNHILELGSHLA